MQTATAQTVDAPVHQRRAHKRFDYTTPCSIRKEDEVFKANVRNLSEGGVNVMLDQLGAIQTGKIVTIKIGELDPVQAVIRWSEGSVYGMQFLSAVNNHPQLSTLIQKLSDEHTY